MYAKNIKNQVYKMEHRQLHLKTDERSIVHFKILFKEFVKK